MPTPTVRTVFAPMRPTVSVAPREPAVASLITGLGGGGPDSKPSKPPVRVTISKQDIHVSLLMVQSITDGTAIVARSMLSPDGRSRCIVINLNRKHALVSKALSRADALLVRYLCAQSLSDFSVWFKDRSDGRAVTRSLREICAVPKNSNFWGSSFVARLAACEALRAIDQLKIYGPMPEVGPFHLFDFQADLRSPSDIPSWVAALSKDALRLSRPENKQP
jgi:hypothetical protein